ncbi:apolipoprotein N-acyltransferase [Verrucomicrobiaceae bacterium E54]|nr:apolipoprotein N-acyltransferase [Verrucomicrobiaceae bacterium E54]
MRAMLFKWLAVLVAGAAMALLVPPFDFGGLVWLVMLPLMATLWTLKGKRAGWKGFGYGWLAGSACFLITFHWLTEVTGVGWVVVALYLALYPALWGMFAATWGNPWREQENRSESGIEKRMRERTGSDLRPLRDSMRSMGFAFALAGFWCGTEWLRGWVFTGFGWNTLGVAFHRTPVLAQSADLLGICGLSFLPVFFQAVLLQVARRLFLQARGERRGLRIDFGVTAVLLALAFCYGVWRIDQIGGRDGARLKVLLVQLNIPQEAARRLWTPEEIHMGYEDETLKALKRIEEADAARIDEEMVEGGALELSTPDWIMWPESALVGRILRIEDGSWGTWGENLETMGRVMDEGEFTLVMGLNEVEGEVMGEQMVEKAGGRIWNSLVMFDPELEMQTFRKRHLVIFGEYIPLVEQVPLLQKIYEQQSGAQYGGAYSRGESLEPLKAEIDGRDVGLIPSVCFEDTVPRLMRKFVRGGPQLILNVTNDGWFKDSPGAAQHFANARFRSIELRRPMVRCANTGVSAAVDAIGTTAHPGTGEPQELRDESGNHITRGSLLVDVVIPDQPGWSLYMLIGDWGVIGLGVLGLGVGWRLGSR